jgi:hypothetical protein
MAHTDRDRLRWMRNHHGKHPAAGECTFRAASRWQRGIHRETPQSCEICDRLWDGVRYYVGTDGHGEWTKDCRREERARAKTAMRECRDWDDLVINYRRPYFD